MARRKALTMEEKMADLLGQLVERRDQLAEELQQVEAAIEAMQQIVPTQNGRKRWTPTQKKRLSKAMKRSWEKRKADG